MTIPKGSPMSTPHADRDDSQRPKWVDLFGIDPHFTCEHGEDGNAACAAAQQPATTPQGTSGQMVAKRRVTALEIGEQRVKGWPDFHPEDYCHRCGNPNLSWWVVSTVWNDVMRPDGPDAPWLWNEIICPQCFTELAGGGSWRLVPDAGTRWDPSGQSGTSRGENVRERVHSAIYDTIVDHLMWIGGDGKPLDYSPEREAHIGDFVDEATDAVLAILDAAPEVADERSGS